MTLELLICTFLGRRTSQLIYFVNKLQKLLHVISRIALMHTACMKNNVEKLEALLAEGLDADAKLKGMTPLFTACQVCLLL